MGNADACSLNSMSVKREKEEKRKISTDSELRKKCRVVQPKEI